MGRAKAAERFDAELPAIVEDVASRVERDLTELAGFAAPGPGITRIAYSREDVSAREWFARRCREAGLDYEADFAGNAVAWTPGARGARPVLIGSHLDSVINGGRYDGTLGVAVGLEIARAAARRRLGYPLGVAAFACEESTRFGFGTIGSRLLMGVLEESALDRLTDRYGYTLRQALVAAGLDPAGGRRLRPAREFARAFLEVHVDQGTSLARNAAGDYPVGLVTSIVGVSRVVFTWSGQAVHSGAGPRRGRRDPLLAAARFILEMDALWKRQEGTTRDSLAVTVGKLDVLPNSPNTVAAEVLVTLDVRSSGQRLLDSVVRRALRAAAAVARAGRVEVAATVLNRGTPARTDRRLLGALEKAAHTLAIDTVRVPSLAGHDATVLGRVFPIAMLFVANPSGVSHTPDEAYDRAGLRRAVALMLAALPRIHETLDRT